MHLITPQELRAQLHYELAQYYLFTKQYLLAREAAAACNTNLQAIPPQTTLYFCHINPVELEGLLQACGISAQPQTLLERFQHSLLSNYADIVPILKLDNKIREIPLVSRRQLELDIEGSISSGILKEPAHLQLQVAALNVVRNIFEWGSIFGSVEYFEKYRELDCLPPLVEGLQEILPHCSLKEQVALKQFLIDCLLHQGGQSRQLLQTVRGIGLFSPEELQDLDEQMLQAAPPVPTNSLASLSDWMCHSKSKTRKLFKRTHKLMLVLSYSDPSGRGCLGTTVNKLHQRQHCTDSAGETVWHRARQTPVGNQPQLGCPSAHKKSDHGHAS